MRILKIIFICMCITTGANASVDWLSVGAGGAAVSGLNGFVGFQNNTSESWFWRRLRFRLDFATTRPIHKTYDSIVDSFIGDDGYTIDDITIRDVDIYAKHMGWLFDFYPLRDNYRWCGWRIGFGLMKGQLKVDADLTGVAATAPAGSFGFKLFNTYYYYTGNEFRGTSQINWKYFGPYIGTGFDIGIFRGFNMFVDAGVVVTGKHPRAKLSIPFRNLWQSTDGGKTWENVIDDGLENIVEAERQRALADVQADLDKIFLVPVIKVGFMYQF